MLFKIIIITLKAKLKKNFVQILYYKFYKNKTKLKIDIKLTSKLLCEDKSLTISKSLFLIAT